eukprot:Hpha_TRINITY_DN24846_c0_g1::TRINITY_DN24846_c0_g1_i1::g.97305::m.97305
MRQSFVAVLVTGAVLVVGALSVRKWWQRSVQQSVGSLASGGSSLLPGQGTFREVEELAVELGFQEKVYELQSHGFDSIPSIAMSEAVPGKWIKPFHWRRLQRAARAVVDAGAA